MTTSMSARRLLTLLPFVTLLACGTSPPPPTPAPVTVKNETGEAAPPGAQPAPPVTANVPPPPAVRSVDAILADAIAAIGGEAAWNAHSSMRLKVELTFQGMGISGTAERIATRANAEKGKPDRMLLTTDVPGTGTLRQGTDGVVVWSEDPINGLRTLSGAEAEQARADAAWVAELRVKELYKGIEAKNEDGPNGGKLECLVLTPKEGAPITSCYDAKTHLQTLVKGTHRTPQGESPFLSAIRDWTDVSGLKMPRTVDTQEGPLTFTMRLVDVKLDEAFEDKLFELPKPVAPAPAPAKGKAKAKAPAKK
jgi:hypothetical protein